jgi:hypothetical protein
MAGRPEARPDFPNPARIFVSLFPSIVRSWLTNGQDAASLALGSAGFQHFSPQEPVCLGLVAWAALF